MSERIQRMARMYSEEGMSYSEIGAHFDISRQRVHQLIGGMVEAHRPALAPAARRQVLTEAHGRVMRNETTLAEEAERLGYSSEASIRGVMRQHELRFADRERPSRRVLAEHGTALRYRQDCRCEACTDANTQYARERRGTGEAPNHGTESGYRNYGCRCIPCKRAHATAQRDYRARVRRQRRPRGSTARGRRITS